MESDDYQRRILETVDSLLSHAGAPPVASEDLVFAFEGDLRYEREHRMISRSKLVPPEEFSERIAPSLGGGPSWIHVNIIPMAGNCLLVTIRSGAKIDNPVPSINASHELHRFATVVED